MTKQDYMKMVTDWNAFEEHVIQTMYHYMKLKNGVLCKSTDPGVININEDEVSIKFYMVWDIDMYILPARYLWEGIESIKRDIDEENRKKLEIILENQRKEDEKEAIKNSSEYQQYLELKEKFKSVK